MSATLSIACMSLILAVASDARDYFTITVVDEATGRGVPLVELRTVNNLVYYTDSQGVVAFHEPGLMDRELFFTVRSHGYEFAKDGFGYRGQKLRTTPGSESKLSISRQNIAERLYRVTGAGIYADSTLVGRKIPIHHGLLNAQVLGSDSVQCLPFRGSIYWFWGDTNRPAHPLGNFHVPGATSRLPENAGLAPDVGVNLEYFVDANGFAKATCKMPGAGPTWIDGLTVVTGPDGQERLFADYVKIKPPLSVYQRGLVEFNVQRQEFEQRVVFPENAPLIPGGHTFHHTTDGIEHVYFAQPFPTVRVRATPDAIQDLSQYEAFTCLSAGSDAESNRVDRDEQGKIRFSWKRGTVAISPELQQKLLQADVVKPREGLFHVRDVETGKSVKVHNGSVYWNEYRHRWVLIATQSNGTSALGEIWYAEADAMVGPWAYARKILTHEKQSFYNPKHHPFFDQQGGRLLYFEGTYTHSFAGNEERTPRYEYNQMMYRLDLDDKRLVLPVAVRRWDTQTNAVGATRDPTFSQIEFFACDRPFPGAREISVGVAPGDAMIARIDPASGQNRKAIYILPADSSGPSNVTALLYGNENDSKVTQYSIGEQTVDGFRRSEKPVGRVWINPVR